MTKYPFFFFVCLFSCHQDKPVNIDLDHSPDSLELFGEGEVSTGLYERDLAISPDGNEIIFTLGDYKQTIRCLVNMERKENGWGEKQILRISGRYQDIEPFYASNGRQLYFASDRPLPGEPDSGDYNIWVAKRLDTGWDEPIPLDAKINTEGDEFYPSVSQNGNLYFTATRENGVGREDIFISRYVDGGYQNPEPLDTNINSAAYEFNAFINPDENLLIFSSYGRADDLGGGDLYISTRGEQGQWRAAKNMGSSINSDKLDYCPFVDITRNNFYFTSDRGQVFDKRINTVTELLGKANQVLNGMGNIYRIKMEEIEVN